MIPPAIAEHVRPLAERFAESGKSLFLVGGIVRDSILGLRIDDGDIDLATNALPGETKALVADRAEAVWTQGERFGTIGCRIDGVLYEITTFRGESYDETSRKPDVVFTSGLETDLSRRDFTVNAIAVDALTGDLYDPFGGKSDLDERILRTPLSPEVSFGDDPLRMLRAARFVSRFELSVLPEIEAAIARQRHRLEIVSAERVRDELFKLLAVHDPRPGLRFLTEHRLLSRWLPELASRPPDHGRGLGPGLDQIVDAVAACPPDPLVRMGALLFDLEESPVTPSERGESARTRLAALRCSGEQRREVAAVVEMADRILVPDGPVDDKGVRRIIRDARGCLDRALVLAEALAGVGYVDRSVDQVREFVRLRAVLGEQYDDLGTELNGREVMEILGAGPGPHIGEALDFLGDVRIERGAIGREESIRLLEQWWHTHHDAGND